MQSGRKIWYVVSGVAYAFSVLNTAQILEVVSPQVGILIGIGAYLSTHFVRGLQDDDGDGISNWQDPDYGK